MKRLKYIGLPVLALGLFAMAACKKNETPKKYAIASLTDTTGAVLTGFTYDINGRLIKLSSPGFETNIEYSGDRLVRRTNINSGTLSDIDSVYYDPQGRIFKVENWTASPSAKVKTTVFIFNANNSINSATVDYVSAATEDELYEYSYTGSQLTERRKSVLNGGVYKLSGKFEFQSYDDKASPFAAIYRPYLTDILNAFVFFAAYPNNLLLGKQTNYDTATGSVTGVVPVTITYTYNSDNLPTRMDLTEGGSLGAYGITYQEL